MKPNSAISTAKRDNENPRHDFPIGVPGVPGRGDGGWGGGAGGGVCGMHDRPLKKGKFFQVEAGHIFVLEYTEGE